MKSLSTSLNATDFQSMRSSVGYQSGLLSSSGTSANSIVSLTNSLGSSAFTRTISGSNGSRAAMDRASFSTDRMSTMLNSPSVRKCLAESLGLNPDASDVTDLIKRRLDCITTTNGSRKTALSDVINDLVASHSVSEQLRLSAVRQAEVGGDRRRQRWVSASDRKLSRKYEYPIDDVIKLRAKNTDNCELVQLLTVGNENVGNEPTKADDVSNVNRPFRMPTFEEFVTLRRRRSSVTPELPVADGTRKTQTSLSEKPPVHWNSFGGSCSEIDRISSRENRSHVIDHRKKRDRSCDRVTGSEETAIVPIDRKHEQAPRRLPVEEICTPILSRRNSMPTRQKNGIGKSVINKCKQSNVNTATSSNCDEVLAIGVTSEDMQLVPNGNELTPASHANGFHDATVGDKLRQENGADVVKTKPVERAKLNGKPPVHPPSSSHRHQARVPSTSSKTVASIDQSSPLPIPSTHLQEINDARTVEAKNETERAEDEKKVCDYDPTIWDFLSDSSHQHPHHDGRSDDSLKQHQPVSDRSEASFRPEVPHDVVAECLPPPTARRRSKAMVEQVAAVTEIVDTEISYGSDLNIIQKEFYEPMKNNGLLTDDQLNAIFLNLNQLIANNDYFVGRLQANIPPSFKSCGDSNAPTSSANSSVQLNNNGHTNVQSITSQTMIGRAFLQSRHMLIAFETYCINQSTAAYLLDQLTQDRELLRVYLSELQKDRAALRKMDLKSFLVVPVQRVTKYPLLLERLYKATPDGHPDKHDIQLARKFIQQTLDSINAKAIGSLKMKRRSSAALVLLKRTISYENVELTQFVFELLKWNRTETDLLRVGRLLCTAVTGGRRSHPDTPAPTNKFVTVHAVIATLGLSSCRVMATPDNPGDEKMDELAFPPKNNQPQTTLRQAAVLLVRERNGKFTALQEPLWLDKCIVSSNVTASSVSFELHEMNKGTYLLKAEDQRETSVWCQYLHHLTLQLGLWRRRRNALANVMTHRRDETT